MKLFSFMAKKKEEQEKEANSTPLSTEKATKKTSPEKAKKPSPERKKRQSPEKTKKPSPEKKPKTPPKASQEKAKRPSPEKKKKKPSPEKKTREAPKPKATKPGPKTTKTDGGDGEEKPKRRPYWGRAGYDNSALEKGSKPVPKGHEICLTGLTFVVTGRLDSFDRDECESLIKKHGGATRTGVTKKLSYLVAGHEPGEGKMSKAKELNTKVISEDDLIKLIVEKSLVKDDSIDPWAHTPDIDRSVWGAEKFGGPKSNDDDDDDDNEEEEEALFEDTPQNLVKVRKISESDSATQRQQVQTQRQQQVLQQQQQPSKPVDSSLWADKYAPTSTSQILGHGARVADLKSWLQAWKQNAKSFDPKAKGPWKPAVVISGPPGIGKTTTATLIAKECGYDVVEFNASDQRSKKTLRETVSTAVGNKSILSMMSSSKSKPEKDVLLLMDEIGGLDRGGTTELIDMVKRAQTPIILICNDKYSQKLKSLVGNCIDMPFSRPPKHIVASYLKKLLREREGVDLHEQALIETVESGGNDLRCILNNLQMWCKTKNKISYDDMQRNQKTANKDTDMSPFQSAQRLFRTKLNWPQTQSLYFNNDLLGLFVQENYIYSGANIPNRVSTLATVSRSLSSADVMEARMRRENNWGTGSAVAFQNSMYPVEKLGRAPFVSFLPPAARQMLPCFPSFMGKLSTTNKNLRLATGVSKSSLTMRSSMPEVVMDYIPTLRKRVIEDLHHGRSQEAAELLSGEYHLDRLDWDFVQDVDTFKKIRNPTEVKSSETSTKRAFTVASKNILDADKAKKKRFTAPANDAVPEDLEEEDSEEEDDSQPAVKKGSKKAASKPSKKKAAAKPSRKKAATAPKAQPKKRGRQNT
eukprot:TRINITY_DN5045_c0_g1_i2.p1 TRINITY_DN5045_c0_g1~~TRINITY_DN5045_c0_g1_i2.p1  ORF type:complete len:866 (+),score=234.15 TRINITY_DN5045_c0_g1_i2:187-2784(+)